LDEQLLSKRLYVLSFGCFSFKALSTLTRRFNSRLIFSFSAGDTLNTRPTLSRHKLPLVLIEPLVKLTMPPWKYVCLAVQGNAVAVVKHGGGKRKHATTRCCGIAVSNHESTH
jgi:hypothetical protein